ncbi:alpha/beta hydrolase [Promicromonospora sp. NPDC023805]|uniref:alpha/beta fold hydrolase n=1 Tax=Promicromonospora sp. NPDC023805 TaxID=3154696 RepID=UPI0033DFE013
MDILLIGGLWLDTSAWDDVVPELEALGHRAVPVALPGQGDGSTTATLEDQVAAVLAAVDAAVDSGSGKPLVVGHSAACTLAWLAADARPEKIAGVVLIGGFPWDEGKLYADLFEMTDGVMPFPGWGPFEGPDSADLSDEVKAALAAKAVPVPEAVARGVVHLADERRFEVPVTVVCPEFTAEQARQWIEAGDVPELARTKNVDLVDLDSGHWPMFTRPAALATQLAKAATP